MSPKILIPILVVLLALAIMSYKQSFGSKTPPNRKAFSDVTLTCGSSGKSFKKETAEVTRWVEANEFIMDEQEIPRFECEICGKKDAAIIDDDPRRKYP